MYHPILRRGAQRQLKKIGKADLVIGLPSYKNAQVAANVARVALDGAHRFHPELRTVLINADAGYRATTRQAISRQASENGHSSLVVSGRYQGQLGQGSAVAALLDASLALDAKATIILDSHTTTITPNWVAGLAHLILENKADLVMPRYRQWPLPNGLLSDLITYPLFRAMWGYNVRRPAAPDLALSPQLAVSLLDEDVWGTAVAAFGLSPWLVAYSAVNGWRVAQTALGEKYTESLPEYQPPAPNGQTQFAACFQDVVTVLFSLAHRYKSYWKKANRIYSLPTLTAFATAPNPIPEPEQNVSDLLDQLALGWIEYRLLWKQVLAPENLAQVEALAALPPDRFYFPADLWAKIIYDFVVVFNKGEADPAQIVRSLLPLYQGRLAAFGQEVAGLAPVGREGTVAAQAVEFEENRAYLKKRWQTYRSSAQ